MIDVEEMVWSVVYLYLGMGAGQSLGAKRLEIGGVEARYLVGVNGQH